MKKIFTIVAAIMFVSTMAISQKNKKDGPPPSNADKFNWGSSKLIPKLQRIAIAEITVNYKLTTTSKVTVQEKSSRKMGGARVSAYLETTDGDLTKAELQTITNNFYKYFQKKLKDGGIDTVGFAQVKAHPFYDKISEGEEDDDKQEKGGNTWITVTANNGKVVHSGMTGFAGGKGKRSMEFVKELDATAAVFKINVDFADVQVGMEIKTSPQKDLYGGWYYPEVTKTSYTWGVNPEMRVGDQDNNNQRTLIWANKGGAQFLYQWNDIPSPGKYADFTTEDVSKARGTVTALFAFRKEFTPVLIQATKEKYKAAAAKALENWADAFVERVIRDRKN